MSCLLTGGIALNCKDSLGGVRALYLTNDSNVLGIANAAPDDGVITGMTMSTGTTFYTFLFQKNNAHFEQKNTINTENGSNYVTQTITVTFTKMDAAKRAAMKIMAQTRLKAVVADMNGVYWYVGEVNGIDATEGTGNTGKAKGDLNGYVITLVAEEKNFAQTVSPGYVGAFLAGVS